MTHLLVAGLASAAALLIWFALARTVVERNLTVDAPPAPATITYPVDVFDL
jgi:hypothetical protein